MVIGVEPLDNQLFKKNKSLKNTLTQAASKRH
jgi:hypothetical protein